MDSMLFYPRRWFVPQETANAARRPVRDDIDALCENICGPTICRKSSGDGDSAQTKIIPARGKLGRRKAEFLPCVDLSAHDDAYILSMELPGVAPESVTFTLDNNILQIAGDKSANDGGRQMLAERVYGSFRRDWRLPQDADTDNITASHKNGVLNVFVPRKMRIDCQMDGHARA